MKNFRTYELALSFYKDCQEIKLKAPLKDQFARASLSIVLNLAEGSGKITTKDRRKFYAIAMGSLRETQALLRIIGAKKQEQQADRLGAYIHKLIKNPGGGF